MSDASNSASMFSQPRLYDFIANSPVISSSDSPSICSRTRSKLKSNPTLPERETDKMSNKQRKAVQKRDNKKRKSTENATASPLTFSQLLFNALEPSQSPDENPPSVPPPSLNEQLSKAKIYAEYLENENASIKSERDILNQELSESSKSIDQLKKQNRKLTAENDKLRREASKKSGTRRFTDVKEFSCQADLTPASELQEATELAIAKYNSVCDHIEQVANSLMNTVTGAKVSLSPINTSPSPPPSAQTNDDRFQTVHNRKRQNRPLHQPQPIPVVTTTAQLHTPPTYSDALRSSAKSSSVSRPGQGARSRRKKVIIIGSSLTDGLSAELNKHNVDSTTFIHRGGLLDEIRDRVPNFFSKDYNKQPDKVFLLAGGNDAEATSIDRTINSYEGLVRDVRKACPRAKIIISSIPPRKNNSIINERIKEVNDYLKDRGQRRDNVQFVDVVPTNLDMFTYKKVHFNNKGKSEFARRLKSYLSD